MKSKFKIKITREDDTICVETRGTDLEMLVGLRCLTQSLITKSGITSELIMKIVVDAIMEAEHEPTKHD